MANQGLLSFIAIACTLVTLLILAAPKLRRSTQWQATVTPLASIVGSGFLIVAPLLHSVLGKWALAGMVGLSLLAYCLGGVIRFNTIHAEEYLEKNAHGVVVWFEHAGQLVLGLSYAISVAFYSSLFVTFVADKMCEGCEQRHLTLATTFLLLTIMGISLWRGSKGLELIELIAVTIKIAIIVGVLAALSTYDVMTGTQWFQHNPMQSMSLFETLSVLAGMLMVTQGFETPRYMGAHYSPAVRIKAILHSQWISIGIYILFIGVTCPLFLTFPIQELNETTISQTLGHIAFSLPALLLVAAAASQLSAALADTIGGGGLLAELVPQKLPNHVFYVLITAIALIIVWNLDVFGIINYASKGFGLYYLTQVLIAAMLLRKDESFRFRKARLVGCAILVATLLFVIFYSVAAPHG